MEMLELAKEIEIAYTSSAGKHNDIISHKVYPFSKSLNDVSNEEKIEKLQVLLNYNHPFVKYWASVIALSHKVLQIEAMTALIDILDIKFENKEYAVLTEEEMQERMNMGLLHGNIESNLVQLYKTGRIGSYPNQIKNNKDYMTCNPRMAIAHFRAKVKRNNRKKRRNEK